MHKVVAILPSHYHEIAVFDLDGKVSLNRTILSLRSNSGVLTAALSERAATFFNQFRRRIRKS